MKVVNLLISLIIINFLTINLSYSNNVNTVAPLVKKVENSVVSIKNLNKIKNNSISGSGFIISKVGHVVTNYHVVKDSEEIQVILDSENYNAKLIGFDKNFDIALNYLSRIGPILLTSFYLWQIPRAV